MRAVRRNLQVVFAALFVFLVAGCRYPGYEAPDPPPRGPAPETIEQERTYTYDHQLRGEWDTEDFQRLYNLAGQPTFGVLVNRYPIEKNPALEDWEELFAVSSEYERRSTGNLASSKEIHVESGDTNVEITDSAPEDGESSVEESESASIVVRKDPQPQWKQLTELEIENAVTTVLMRAGIAVADPETLKSKAPPVETPAGTAGVVPDLGVQIVVKYLLNSETFRISIKGVATEDGRVVAHVAETMETPEFTDEVTGAAEGATWRFLRELTRVWSHQFDG